MKIGDADIANAHNNDGGQYLPISLTTGAVIRISSLMPMPKIISNDETMNGIRFKSNQSLIKV
jgi:hypothetical protein